MAKTTALIPTEQKFIDFYGDEVIAVMVETDERPQVYVPLRPICDYLGVAWTAQRARINRDPVLADEMSVVIVTITTEGATATQRREMSCLPLDYLNGWLFGISSSRVKAEIRENLIRYQRDCYRVLADAYLNKPTKPAGMTATQTTLHQVREMGLAIVRMAEEQLEFEQRLNTVEGRVDKASVVVGDLTKRISTLEERFTPNQTVSTDQAMQVSQAVKAVAIAMGKKSGRNEFGGVYGELYRRFEITSYKLLPTKRFNEAMKFLTDWHSSLEGDSAF